MFVNSIDTKEIFTRPDGEVIRDLTQTMFELKNKNHTAYSIYKVPKDYVMRPDLISKAVYNNSIYAEIILKYNGISNPFSINEGDLILIPDLESATSQIKQIGKGSATDAAARIRNSYKYIDPTKVPGKNNEAESYNNRHIVAGAAGALPPNLAEEGTTQVTYRNGRAYFNQGADTCLKSGISSGEFLTKVIQNRK